MFDKFDNNTIAIIAIGTALIIGTYTKQTEIVTGAVGALAGFITGKGKSSND